MTKKPVLLVTHVTEGDPGQIPIALEAMGRPVRIMRANKGEPFPTRVEDFAGIASFGGPQSANDDHVDHIRAELDWIPRVMAAGVPLLGICLGAQMVARTLGATVGPHPDGWYEFGYYPIHPVDGAAFGLDGPLTVAHRHGEAFTLPSGATHLAWRESFPNQAFRHGRTTWGIQFHPEVNDAVLDRWLNREPPPEDLARDGAQTPAAQRAGHARHRDAMHAWLGGFLATWLASGAEGARAGAD